MKLFCAGVGAQHPDIENASRRMKPSEFEDCHEERRQGDRRASGRASMAVAFGEANGGIGIPLRPRSMSTRRSPRMPVRQAQHCRMTWKDVNPALPAEKILVYGPPSTSGTRDALQGADPRQGLRN